jgi:hypothetical protein
MAIAAVMLLALLAASGAAAQGIGAGITPVAVATPVKAAPAATAAAADPITPAAEVTAAPVATAVPGDVATAGGVTQLRLSKRHWTAHATLHLVIARSHPGTMSFICKQAGV